MANSTIKVAFLGDTSNLQGAFRDAENESRSFVGRLGGAVTGALETVVKIVAGATAAVTGFGVAIAGIAVKGGLKRALDVESARVQLDRMGYSLENIDSLVTTVTRAFDGTIFTTPEGFKLTQLLLGAGVAMEDVEKRLVTISDFAAHANVDLIRIGDIFLKIQAQGSVTAVRLNQLTTAGISMGPIAEVLGVTEAEMRKMASTGKLSAEMFFDAAAAADVYAGAAKASGDTTAGAFRNVNSQLARLGEILVQPFIGVDGPAVRFFKALRQAIIDFRPAVAIAAGVIQRNFIPRLDRLTEIIQNIGPLFKAFTTGEITEFTRTTNDGGIVVQTMSERVKSLAVRLIELGERFRELRAKAGDIWETIRGGIEIVSTVLGGLVGVIFRGVIPAVWDAVGGLEGLKSRLDTAADAIGRVFDSFRDGGEHARTFLDLVDEVGETFDIIYTPIKTFFDTLMNGQKVWQDTGTAFELIEDIADGVATVFFSLMAGIGDSIVIIGEWWTELDKSRISIDGLFEAISILLNPLGLLLRDILPALLPVLLNMLPPLIELGNDALPALATIVSELVQAILPPLVTILEWLAGVIERYPGLVQIFAAAFAAVKLTSFITSLFALGGALNFATIKMKILNVVSRVNPFIAIATAVIAIAYLIYEHWDAIVAFFKKVWKWISDTADKVWTGVTDAVVGSVTAARDWIVGVWDNVTGWLSDAWNSLVETATKVWDAITGAISDAVQWMVETFLNFPPVRFLIDAFEWLSKVVYSVFDTIRQIIWGAVQFIAGIFINLIWNVFVQPWINLINAAKNAWEAVKDAVGTAVEWLKTTLQPFFDWVQEMWGIVSDAFGTAIEWVKTQWTRFRDWLGDRIDQLKAIFNPMWDAIKTAFGKARDWVQERWNALRQWFSGRIQPFKNVFATIWDTLKEKFTAAQTWLREKWNTLRQWFVDRKTAFKNVFIGMWDGIRDAFRSAVNWIIDKWNGIKFEIPSISLPWGGEIGGVVIRPPQIPRLHSGGVFRTELPGGEGLALLKDGERVMTPNATRHSDVLAMTFAFRRAMEGMEFGGKREGDNIVIHAGPNADALEIARQLEFRRRTAGV